MKLANENFLNINVDALFEQYSVSEIGQVYKNLQNEIETKKEELRTMVGERYRDLLKAADTIGEMPTTINTVITHVNEITNSCRNLNEQQLIGFRTTETSSQQTIDLQTTHKSNKSYAIAMQIKLLTSLPELIWFIMESNYFLATQLFFFSRHIYTGLQLDTNKTAMNYFPLVAKQWKILSQFFFTIKQSCMVKLEEEKLTAEDTSISLASLLLLDNYQIDRLLTTFIQLQSKAFKYTILDSSLKYERIKDKIIASLKVVNETLDLLYRCFISSNDREEQGLLIKEFLVMENGPPIISQIHTRSSLIVNALPDIIANYKPHIEVKKIDLAFFTKTIKSWLEFIRTDNQEHLQTLIDVIPSIKIIHDIERQGELFQKPKFWINIWDMLSLPVDFNLYQLYYQPLISIRIKEIVRSSCQSAIEISFTRVKQLLTENGGEKLTDLKTHAWLEETTDVPLRLKEALDPQKQSHKLLMKTKGYTPEIVNVCNLLDRNLKILFDDLRLYLDNNYNYIDAVDGELKDHETIVAYLRECCREEISNFITNLKSMEINKTIKNTIFLARLLQAISELCPNLKYCLSDNIILTTTRNSKTSRIVGVSNNSENTQFDYWISVCGLLEEESLRIWIQWISLFLDNLNISESTIDKSMNLMMLLNELPHWNTINIEETDEHNNPINSTIRIPSQPSLSLQQFLHNFSTNLNECVPSHTLSKNVINLLIEQLISVLCQHYERYAHSEFVKSNQNISLQYYFDIKFINIIFVTVKGGNQQNKQTEQLQELLLQFKSNVDPFDFELFHKYINQNTKKSVYRMQHQLGCLIVNFDQLNTILGNQQIGQENDPNVLTLSVNSTTTNWFPMLPIVIRSNTNGGNNPGNIDNDSSHSQINKLNSEKIKYKKTVQQSTSNPNILSQTNASQNLANVKSGAAAFFGAMSQDWFR